MLNIEKEREAFEEALAGNKIHNLHVCTIFDIEKNVYFASDICDPSEDHIVESINLSWRMWQASALRAEEKLEGCVVVPVEPTDLMINAYRDNSIAPISTLSIVGYKAMVEAARGGK